MLFYFSISNISDLKANSINDHTKRTELREVIEYISQNNFDNTKNLEILSFNYEISIWLLLNGFGIVFGFVKQN